MEVVLQGLSGRTVLGPAVLTIGRTADNQLVVNDPKASARHAEMRPSGQGYSIIDLGSTNGTFVNDQRLDRNVPRPLASGDRVRIGDTVFTYIVTGVAPGAYGAPGQGSYSEYTPTIAAEPPAGSFTGYGQEARQYVPPPQLYESPQQQYAPPPPAYPPYAQLSPQQPYAPPGAPVPPLYASPRAPAPMAPASLPYAPAPGPGAPVPPLTPKKAGAGSRVLLIVLAIVVVLGGGGGFLVYHFLTLPQPVINVTSKYTSASTLAGSTGTVFHITGQKFSAKSAITFLLDGVLAPGSTSVQSDANGNVTADLTVTDGWVLGHHTLTASDASNYTTKSGFAVVIVPQGEASTPGPHGAPPDDTMKLTLNVTIQHHDVKNNQQLNPLQQMLVITGQPDPAGGSVCQSRDGQTQTVHATFKGGGSYTEMYTLQCSGTYKGGKLSYTEMATSDHYSLADGGTCTASAPYVYEHLEGSFTAPNTISGTYNADSINIACTDKTTVTADAESGAWTGTM